MKIVNLLFILLILITSSVLANDMKSNFDKRNKYQNSAEFGSPPSGKFLQTEGDVSSLQGLNDKSLTDKGNEALRSHPIGKTLQNAEEKKIDSMERYKINPENPYLKASMKIEDDPLPKVSGKGMPVGETVTTVKVEKSCTEGVDFDVDVGFELIVDCSEVDYLGPKQSELRQINFPGGFLHNHKMNWGYAVKWKKGRWGWHITPYQTSGGEVQKDSIWRHNPAAIIADARSHIASVIAVPIEQVGENVTFPAGGRGIGQIHTGYPRHRVVWNEYQFSYNYIWQDKLKKLVENGEYWQVVTEGTEKLADANECVETGRVCLKSGIKVFFDKYEISRPCWYQKVSYHCRSEPKDGCDHLYRQNCQLKDSDCEYKFGNLCLKWKRKFMCGGKKKELHYPAVNSPIFCLGGDCHTPVIKEDDDFANVAYLAALNDAKDDCIKTPNGACKNPITVFPGQVDGCKKIIAGVINCCSSMKGWGKDVNMCRCSGGEKGLAIKREKKLCHSVGTYCHKKDPVFGKCLVKKTNFCCFSSKLARIFHEQGRIQLGSGWGSPSSPDCRPMTLDELIKLDFSKFDMEELFEALLSKGRGNANKPFPHIVPGEVPAKQKEHMSMDANKDNSQGM